MRRTYGIRIHRVGMADLQELCEAEAIDGALCLVRAILQCNDPNVVHVTISVKLAEATLSPIVSPELPSF